MVKVFVARFMTLGEVAYVKNSNQGFALEVKTLFFPAGSRSFFCHSFEVF